MKKSLTGSPSFGPRGEGPFDWRNPDHQLHALTREFYKVDSQAESLESIKKLLDEGADINYQREIMGVKHTPLSIAASRGYEVLVSLFLERGAVFDEHLSGDQQAINTGATPLHLASMNGHNEVVKLLLNAGADLNKRKKVFDPTLPPPPHRMPHMSALEMAQKKGRTEVVETLSNWEKWSARWSGVRASWCLAVARAIIKRGDASFAAVEAGAGPAGAGSGAGAGIDATDFAGVSVVPAVPVLATGAPAGAPGPAAAPAGFTMNVHAAEFVPSGRLVAAGSVFERVVGVPEFVPSGRPAAAAPRGV